MFIGNVADWKNEQKYLPAVFGRVFEYLEKNGTELEPGRHEIDGSALFVNVESGDTKPAAERLFEAHAKYIDVQVLFSGEERQDYRTSPSSEAPTIDRMAEKDIAFYPEPELPQTLVMKPGMYVVYFPGELHAPNLAVTEPAHRLKGIFKIRIDQI